MSRPPYGEDPRILEFWASVAARRRGEPGSHQRWALAVAGAMERVAEDIELHYAVEHQPQARVWAMQDSFTRWNAPILAIGVAFRAEPEELRAALDALPKIASEPLDAIERFQRMPYSAYLRTDHWRKVRAAALKRAEYRCVMCNSDSSLEVHHRTYKRIGCERAADVYAVCSRCHEKFHEADRRAA